MQGNEPSNKKSPPINGPTQYPTPAANGTLASLALPQTIDCTHDPASRAPSNITIEFDLKVREFGENLRAEIIKNTPKDAWGRPKWTPYSLNLDNIPEKYHERVAHYLLQAYQLPFAERHVAYNAQEFKATSLTGLVGALASRGNSGIIALGAHLYNFRGVNQHLLLELLVHSPSPWAWLSNAPVFDPSFHATLVSEALKAKETNCLFDNFSKFRLTTREQEEVVKTILESACREKSYHLRQTTSDWLNQKRKGSPAIEKLPAVLHTMATLNHETTLREVINFSVKGATNVAANLHRYPGVDCQALAQACHTARYDIRWRKNPRHKHHLQRVIKYLSDFSTLSREEQSARLLEIAPDAILRDPKAHPSLSLLQVVRANRHALGPHVEALKQLAPNDLLTLAVEVVNKDPLHSIQTLVRRFRELTNLDREAFATVILSKRPEVFLDAGAFLGFSPSELLQRLLRMGAAENEEFFVSDRGGLSLAEKWIRCGGHGNDAAETFIAVGKGQLVIENISCFQDLSADLLSKAALQASFWHIINGRVDSAKRCFTSHNVSRDELNTHIEADTRHFPELQKFSPESAFRRAAIAAWSLYCPEIREIGIFGRDRTILEPYRSLFGSDTPEHLERNADQKLLENLVSIGIPLFIQLRWLRDDTLGPLSEILPRFLEGDLGSVRAWRAHQVNLQATPEDARRPNPFCRDDINPGFEISILKRFYEEFGVIQAPTLYLQGFRGYTISPGMKSWPALKQQMPSNEEIQKLSSFLKQQKNRLVTDPPLVIDRPRNDFSTMADEYLAGWTGTNDEKKRKKGEQGLLPSNNARFFAKKLSRHQELLESRSIRPKATSLRTECIHVRRARKQGPRDARVAAEISPQYKAFRTKLGELRNVSPSDVFLREKNRVRTAIEKRLRNTEQWLAHSSKGPADAPETTRAQGNKELFLKDLTELEQIESSEELISFICVRNASDLRNSAFSLALSLGLDAASEDDLEALAALGPSVTKDSIRTVYAFLANALYHSSLRPLEKTEQDDRQLGPPSSHDSTMSYSDPIAVARQYLHYTAFEEAYRKISGASIAIEESASGVEAQELEELIVLPTRGVLAEIAGYFSDACWTNTEDLMLKHPNATALVFARRPEPVSMQERESGSIDFSEAELIGACYILQVQDMDGNSVLALRGLNPRIRKIKNLDIGSFVTSLIDEALVPYAKALGAKKIVVPFDSCGHAQTNLPEIKAYLDAHYGGSPYVPLNPAAQSTLFNDRLIFDKCRLLREI